MNREDTAALAGETRAVPARAVLTLGYWNLYFLIKLILFWRELIGFHGFENLAFAAFLAAPIAVRAGRAWRTAIAIPAAIALAYYDSWLPPANRLLSQAGLVSGFSPAYLLELAGRFIDWNVIGMLALGWAACVIAMRIVRVGVLVFAVLVGVTVAGTVGRGTVAASAVSSPGARNEAASAVPADPDQALRAFYEHEQQRAVTFDHVDNAAPFDVVFLHICSLSWDDLQATGLDRHPLWKNMDFLFSHFNSAASYSGPAAIRLNRATCGQTPHRGLYDPAPDQCYLMPALKQAGFETNFALNHDGHFDDFLTLLRRQGVNAPLQPFTGIAAPLRAFDNTPIYDDFGVLSRWLETRRNSPTPHVALYYNSISLHDGNRIMAGANAHLSSRDSYRPRVEKLLNDLTGFMDRMQASGRRAIVIVVPEHGAAVRGDKFQIAGLRELPTPAITLVPVGVRIIGQDVTRTGPGAQIGTATSYLGLSQLVARLVKKPPYGPAGLNTADYVADLPATELVSENEDTVMMRANGKYMFRQGQSSWQEYAAASRSAGN
ncbi:MAG TPA: cellulose biosynthesis protein BcsG [Burkholderiaceae bacterium]|nr:cellulose biosynthesis protein BcsG [Burkholderiaceae bacterium]